MSVAVNGKLKRIVAELRERFEALYEKRLVRIVLYGSQARGDSQPASDIDVLVVLTGPVRAGEEIARTSDIVADLSLCFDEVISCVFMDEDDFLHRAGPLLRNIRREGIAV